MACAEKVIIRTKIVINCCPIEQVQHFKCSDRDITSDCNNDVANQIDRFRLLFGTVERDLKNKICRHTWLNFHKTSSGIR